MEIYEYPDDAFDALAAADVPWTDADYVLRWSRPLIRQFLGPTTLLIIGLTRSGRWLLVSLYEVGEDVYAVRGARWLTDAEAADAEQTLKGR